ncbi:MAG: hypothetical protein WC623_00325 [Pedobacter sp.]|jgi:hypothetical protein|uniref:hypothetical protein n=1 Tax=Pedobacter sp. TaxID=1411316 RepID=UPI00356257ED
MNTVIFKTSVQSRIEMIAVKPVLNLLFGKKNWLFSYEDKLLKVMTTVPCTDMIKAILKENGLVGEELRLAY